MYITSAQRGTDYYGLVMSFTVPNEADSTAVRIAIDCEFNEAATYGSGTEPVIRVMVEGRDITQVDMLAKQLADVVTGVAGS